MNEVDLVHECDVLVIGGGLAGCVAAITAKMQGAESVILVDKGHVSRSGQSTFAAGIWALKLPEDNLDDWIEETIVWGDYINDQDWVVLLWERVFESAEAVDAWGRESGKVTFERDGQGAFVRKKSRGHHRTAHGVINSLAMMEGLRAKASSIGVDIVERVMITDLICDEGDFWAAMGFNCRTGETYLFKSRAAILSASGAGFKSIFMGHRNLTGDIQAAAYREGVILRNMENISHNTCAREYDTHGMNLFVNVGGKWLNNKDEEFMWAYDPLLGNRANQPIKCIALAREAHEGRGPIMFDMTAATPEDQALCKKILPETFKMFDRAGINPFAQRIEWVTSFYGTIINGGGIHVDTKCATNIPGIFSAGDITCIPPHGGYSFGGVNIAFCAVSGLVAGEESARYAKAQAPRREDRRLKEEIESRINRMVRPSLLREGCSPDEIIYQVQRAIIPYRASLLKTRASLEDSLQQIEGLMPMLDGIRAKDFHYLVKAHEARNLATLADLMIKASLMRTESRGFHFREDYPIVDNKEWLKWIMIQREEEGSKLWTVDVPTPYVKPPAEFLRPKGLRQV